MGKLWNTIIYSNLLPFVLLSVFLFIIIYNPVFHKNKSKLFIIATLIIMATLMVKSLDYLLSYEQARSYAILRKITTFINFSAGPVVPLLLYAISIEEKMRRKMYVPLIVNVIICLLSIHFGFIFSISNHNEYTRGPLFFIPFMITVAYLVLLIIKNKNQSIKSRNMERMFLMFTIVLLFSTLIIEMVFGFYFISWTSAAITFPLYYLLLNVNNSIIDPLTNAYNRLMYNMDLEKMSKRHKYVIALLDINDFKFVNDNYGHEAGDQALIHFVKIISYDLPNSVSLYRIGGDEFALISKKIHDVSKISYYLDQARKHTAERMVDFSYGIDVYDHAIPLSKFLKQVDFAMYENKRNDKQKKQLIMDEEAKAKILV